MFSVSPALLLQKLFMQARYRFRFLWSWRRVAKMFAYNVADTTSSYVQLEFSYKEVSSIYLLVIAFFFNDRLYYYVHWATVLTDTILFVWSTIPIYFWNPFIRSFEVHWIIIIQQSRKRKQVKRKATTETATHCQFH